jgi:hypothetical protein
MKLPSLDEMSHLLRDIERKRSRPMSSLFDKDQTRLGGDGKRKPTRQQIQEELERQRQEQAHQPMAPIFNEPTRFQDRKISGLPRKSHRTYYERRTPRLEGMSGEVEISRIAYAQKPQN